MNPFNAAASTWLTSKVLLTHCSVNLKTGFTQLGAFQSLWKRCNDFVAKFHTEIFQAVGQRFESRSLNHLKCYQRSEVGEPEDDVPATQEPGARPEPGNEKSGNLTKKWPKFFSSLIIDIQSASCQRQLVIYQLLWLLPKVSWFQLLHA